MPNVVIAVLFLGVGILVLIGGIDRILKNRHASVKTVSAAVVDKHRAEVFSQYSGDGKREKYVVVFSVDGKKKGFSVFQFSYDGYQIGEKGRLTYQGDRLIGFH